MVIPSPKVSTRVLLYSGDSREGLVEGCGRYQSPPSFRVWSLPQRGSHCVLRSATTTPQCARDTLFVDITFRSVRLVNVRLFKTCARVTCNSCKSQPRLREQRLPMSDYVPYGCNRVDFIQIDGKKNISFKSRNRRLHEAVGSWDYNDLRIRSNLVFTAAILDAVSSVSWWRRCLLARQQVFFAFS